MSMWKRSVAEAEGAYPPSREFPSPHAHRLLPPTRPPPSSHPTRTGAASAHALLEVVPLIEEEVGREVLVLLALHEGLGNAHRVSCSLARERMPGWPRIARPSVHALSVVPI